MRRLRSSWSRVIAPLLAAGVLLQAGSCAIDLNGIVSGVATSVATDFITTMVFRAFNLTP